ncbi:MAG TPA: OmpA family protein, partial [Cyclobacteriaceae bacterium]|nr:OmpA family protein [Cyclobacteriaceae bacterium]
DLQDKSLGELTRVIRFLNENSNIRIKIGGHTDDQGSASYNKQLSLLRARAVNDYLVANGIPSKRIEYAGFGQEMPAFPNDSEANRSRNRRIEFEIID